MSMIVGLYDDLATLQQVISDLEDNGFDRQNIHFATNDPRAGKEGSGGFLDNLRNLFGSEPKEVNPRQQLVDWGIDDDDAQHYAEAVRRGMDLVLVNAPDNRLDEARQIMEGYDPSDIQELSGQWHEQGWQGYDETAQPYTEQQINEERTLRAQNTGRTDETHVPIVEEEMRVGKREVQRGGIRVYKTVTEQPVEETHTLRDETVNVERRPADRLASQADLDAAFRDQDIEVTETGEELIADKQARVTGEVVVSKQVEEHPETVRDTVRRTEVHTEDLGQGQSRRARDFSSFESDYQNNYNMLYADRGHDYNYYQPGYRYGYDLAGMDRYRGKRWNEIEPNARNDWERQHPNDRWDDFKDSVRFAWERMTGASQDTGPDADTSTWRGREDYGTGLGTGDRS